MSNWWLVSRQNIAYFGILLINAKNLKENYYHSVLFIKGGSNERISHIITS